MREKKTISFCSTSESENISFCWCLTDGMKEKSGLWKSWLMLLFEANEEHVLFQWTHLCVENGSESLKVNDEMGIPFLIHEMLLLLEGKGKRRRKHLSTKVNPVAIFTTTDMCVERVNEKELLMEWNRNLNSLFFLFSIRLWKSPEDERQRGKALSDVMRWESRFSYYMRLASVKRQIMKLPYSFFLVPDS